MKTAAALRVSKLEALILAHHLALAQAERSSGGRRRATGPVDGLDELAACTASLLDEGLVSAGELVVMHQRARAIAADARQPTPCLEVT